jgi:hypothetical protein
VTAIPLDDEQEVLFRQIHPSFMQGDEVSSIPFAPTSQAFAPTAKDGGYLSVDRSSKTSAAESFKLFNGNGSSSAAVYGLTVGEFSVESISCVDDPIEASDGRAANLAHAVADYTPHAAGQQKNKAKRLKQKAIVRGRLHP